MPLKRHRRIAVIAAALVVQTASARAHICTVSATGVSFGLYDPRSSSPRDSTATVNVGCTGLVGLTIAVNYSISLSAGNGSVTSRYMSSGMGQLRYQLYGDAARTSVWGDGTGPTAVVTGSWLIGLFVPYQSYTIYGRIPPNQHVAPGTYTDTILVTVVY